jgi:hypothetical protein
MNREVQVRNCGSVGVKLPTLLDWAKIACIKLVYILQWHKGAKLKTSNGCKGA